MNLHVEDGVSERGNVARLSPFALVRISCVSLVPKGWRQGNMFLENHVPKLGESPNLMEKSYIKLEVVKGHSKESRSPFGTGLMGT